MLLVMCDILIVVVDFDYSSDSCLLLCMFDVSFGVCVVSQLVDLEEVCLQLCSLDVFVIVLVLCDVIWQVLCGCQGMVFVYYNVIYMIIGQLVVCDIGDVVFVWNVCLLCECIGLQVGLGKLCVVLIVVQLDIFYNLVCSYELFLLLLIFLVVLLLVLVFVVVGSFGCEICDGILFVWLV